MRGKDRAWAVLPIGFLSQNLTIGLTFGSIGLLVGDLSEEFGASRSLVALSIALVSLMMGLLSPLVGYLLDRWSIKGVMAIGCLLGALGFWTAANATSIHMFIGGFGVLAGAAAAGAGSLSVTKLASNWFERTRGRAIAFVNLPVLVALGPPIFGAVIASAGWRGLMFTFSLLLLLFVPLLLVLQGKPRSAAAQAVKSLSHQPVEVRWSESLSDGRLWTLALISGMLLCGGIVLVTHIIAHAQDQGVSLLQASFLLSIQGGAAVVGAMAFGWLADAASPRTAVLVNGICQLLFWPFLLAQSGFAGMAVGVAVLGLCAGGAFPALSALAGQIFGAQRVGTVLGQIMLLIIPFNFGAAPLAGYLYDFSGSYFLSFLLQAALCLGALAGLLVLARLREGEAALPEAAA